MVSHVIRRIVAGLFTIIFLAVALSQSAAAAPYSALVVEVESDRVLYSQAPDELRYPASLTKMMTLYLTFEALSKGQLSLGDTMPASAFAVSKPPSRLGLRVGDTLSVEEGILGLVTQSANDAATVIAETLAGSESAFAEMMTRKARELGMANTVFRNAQGLPDSGQVTTAWDMYRLAKALLKNFPEYYHYFSTESFWFKNRSFHNHNHLLNNYPGTDGIKTGFINASGFNLVASAKRNGVRLVGVVFGGPTHSRRDAHMREILDDGFAQLDGAEPAIHTAGLHGWQPRPILRRPTDMEKVLLTPAKETLERPAPLKVKSKGPGADSNADSTVALKSRNPRNQPSSAAKLAGVESRKASWAVQVGVFAEEKAAKQRLVEAHNTAPYAFRHARAAVLSNVKRGKKTYVAYFNGLSKEDAELACQFLRRKRLECSPSSSG